MGQQNYFDGHRLTSKGKVEYKLISYFALKPKEFYKRGICKLVDRWNDVLRSNWGYVN